MNTFSFKSPLPKSIYVISFLDFRQYSLALSLLPLGYVGQVFIDLN